MQHQWLPAICSGAFVLSLIPGRLPAQGVAPISAHPTVLYRVAVRVDDTAGAVSGALEIHLHPTATDTLRWLTVSAAPVQPNPPHPATIRIAQLRVDGIPATLSWPWAPDSSRMRVGLPRPVTAGDSAVVSLAFTTLAANRRNPAHTTGRRVQLIHWYPVLIDETSGTTIPSPAMATVLVYLDVAGDQVIGGTGVPVCGDPGWQGAKRSIRDRLTLGRDRYPGPGAAAAAEGCGGAMPGRKTVVWYAEDVTEAAFAMSPTFRYEEGDFLEKPVHVLYERGYERVWGAGLATRRVEAGLAWTTAMAGRYPWPQITLIQSNDAQSYALPMVLLADTASQSALLGLLGTMTTHEMMLGGASIFTDGTAAFQTDWFFEELGRDDYARLERQILDWDLDGVGRGDEPLPRTGPTAPCRTSGCRRAEFTIHQLRRWAGDDAAMRRLLQTLFAGATLAPTVPGSFQRAARELITPDPDPLYVQVPHGGTWYDDAVAAASRAPLPGEGWITRVVVQRRAAGRFPQRVWVLAARDSGVARADQLTPRETLYVRTRSQPRTVLLDPLVESHDWNMLNNRRDFGWSLARVLGVGRPNTLHLDTWFSQPTARNRLMTGWSPAVWYNDIGGWTPAVRLRQNYLGRFERNELWIGMSTGSGPVAGGGQAAPVFDVRIRDPVALRAIGWHEELRLASLEGRALAAVEIGRARRTAIADSLPRGTSFRLEWRGVTDPGWTSPAEFDDAGTLELTLGSARTTATGGGALALGAGHAYRNGGRLQPSLYGRTTLTAALRRPLGAGLQLGLRAFVGATISELDPPRQRLIRLAGADPYQRFDNPLLRTPGALLTRPGWHYHAPGGAGVRGLDPGLASRNAVGGSVEVGYDVWVRPHGFLLKRVTLAGFADAAAGDGDLARRRHISTVADAGIGIRFDQRIGQTAYQLRFDLPLWVSRPELALSRTTTPWAGRWTFSFAPAF